MISLVESASCSPVCSLKISLIDTKPLVWRRVLVRDNVLLSWLHKVFQIVMGWQDSHLHRFEVGDKRYGLPELDDWDEQLLDERRYRLFDLGVRVNDGFVYKYDYGDNWNHEVRLEKLVEVDYKHPVCLEGMNACPPEDCGGVDGYLDLLKIMAKPKHPEYEAMKMWIGGDWDAAKFELSRVNLKLKRVR